MKTKFILLLVSLFFYRPQITTAQTILPINPSMITDESESDANKLVDEQNIVGDPQNNNGGSPTSNWFPGWDDTHYPASAYIDLGQEVAITSIYLYDINDIGDFKVYHGSPDNWNLLFTDELVLYNQWVGHSVDVTTQYLRFVKDGTGSNVAEIVIYAESDESSGESVPHPDLTPNDMGIKVFNNILHTTSSYMLGAVRNHVEQPYEGSTYTQDYHPILEKYGEIIPSFGVEKKIYRLGHGITDGREDYDYINGYHFEDHWDSKGPYPYDDIRIGLSEAEIAQSDVIMVVNYGSGDVDEAGRLVSFLNKVGDPLRDQYPNNDGSNAPWNVEYFEIGNEITWDMETGHNEYAMTPEQYATRAKTFATTMRANSDIPINIGLVGTTNSNWTATDWQNGPTLSDHRVHNLDPLIDIMGEDINFIIFHNYSKWPFDELDNIQSMSQAQFSRDLINDWVLPTIREGEERNGLPSHSIKLANTEYHSENGNWEDVREMGETVEFLYTAGEIINAINIEDIIISINFSFFHEDVSVDNMFFFDLEDPNTQTGVFKLQQMVAETTGNTVVETQGYNLPIHSYLAGNPSDNYFESMYGYPNNIFPLEELAFAATKHDDGTLVLLILNKMENNDIIVPIDPSFDVGNATIYTLKGNNYTDTNYQVTTNDIVDLNSVSIPGTSVSIIVLTPIETPLDTLFEESKNDIVVFPNPTKDLIYIKSNNPIKQVIIFDQLGKVIQTSYSSLNQLDISNFSNGIYILKITDADGNLFNKKIVKK